MDKPSMINYILDQPRALRATWEIRNLYCNPFKEVFIKNNIKLVYFLGSGTSYHASIVAAEYFEKYVGVDAVAMIPTQFANYEKINNNGVYAKEEILVVGISQSGTSVSTINAVKKANESGYLTLAITDALDSLITKETDHVVKLTCGVEEIPIETRGYSVTVFQMFVTAIEIAKELTKISLAEYEKLTKEVEHFLDVYPQALNDVENWYLNNQDELLKMKKGHIASYGINTCTMYEGVLKLYETFKKPLSAYEIEELIHGPNMAFDEDTYIFIVAGKEKEFERIPLFINYFKSNEISEHVFVISNGNREYSKKDCFINVDILEDLSPLIYTLVFQITAARNCIAAGIDTSKRPPRRRAFAHIYKEDME